MGIRKQDLRDYINGKISKRQIAIQKEVRVAVEAAVKPVVYDAFAAAAPLERQAVALQEQWDAFLVSNKRFDNWVRRSVLRDLDTIAEFRSEILRGQTTLLLSNLLNCATNGVIAEVQELVDGLKKQLASKIEEFQNLKKLSDELHTIINASHNGDKAFKQLQALGVDLSDFNGGTPNLPAVVKLSVDPCVINGDCR